MGELLDQELAEEAEEARKKWVENIREVGTKQVGLTDEDLLDDFVSKAAKIDPANPERDKTWFELCNQQSWAQYSRNVLKKAENSTLASDRPESLGVEGVPYQRPTFNRPEGSPAQIQGQKYAPPHTRANLPRFKRPGTENE